MSERIDVLGAERDARTIYDIACIREARPDATREDVEFKTIALRNWEAIAAVAELVDDLKRIQRRAAAHPDDDDADRKRNLYHCESIARAALARIAPNELHDKAAELRGRGE